MSHVAQTLTVLIEETKDGWSAGRSYRDAPEIDGQVYVQQPAESGKFFDVKITQVSGHDLAGDV